MPESAAGESLDSTMIGYELNSLLMSESDNIHNNDVDNNGSKTLNGDRNRSEEYQINNSYRSVQDIRIGGKGRLSMEAIGSVMPPTAEESVLCSIFSKDSTTTVGKMPAHSVRGMIIVPKSCGKTSLAMDLAHSICRSSTSTSLRRNSTVNNCADKVVVYTNTYRHSVAFVVHESKRENTYSSNNGRSNEFPARCYHCSSSTPSIFLNPLSSMNKEDFESLPRSSLYWDFDALNCIQIKYISTHTELIGYLMSIQMLPLHERPLGGIIIDDLHLYFEDNSNLGVKTTRIVSSDSDNTKMLQTLACIEDTAAFLDSYWNQTYSYNRVLKAEQPYCSILVTIEESFRLSSGIMYNFLVTWFKNCYMISDGSIEDENDSAKRWKISTSTSQTKTAAYIAIENVGELGLVLKWTYM